jgi:hypothetical protein
VTPTRSAWGKTTVLTLAIVVTVSSVAAAAPLPPALTDPAARDADLAAIARALEGRLVAAHLGTLGLSREAVQDRVTRLDDTELHRMAQSLSQLALGGDEQRELTGEQKAGLVLIIIVALAIAAGLVFLTVSGF